MLLSDGEIYTRMFTCISPFLGDQIRRNVEGLEVLSFGLSSCGYDVRLSAEAGLRIFAPEHFVENLNPNKRTVIDPKKFEPKFVHDAFLNDVQGEGQFWILPPHSYALGATVECFTMPTNIAGLCLGKSTMARCGLIVNATPLEPGWEGQLVLEIANSTSLPMRIYAEEGIAQILFFQISGRVERPYGAGRKYQSQQGVTLAKI